MLRGNQCTRRRGTYSGAVIGGRFGDRRLTATIITTVAANALVLLLIALSDGPVRAVVLVFLMALTGFTVIPVVTSLAAHLSGDAPHWPRR